MEEHAPPIQNKAMFRESLGVWDDAIHISHGDMGWMAWG